MFWRSSKDREEEEDYEEEVDARKTAINIAPSEVTHEPYATRESHLREPIASVYPLSSDHYLAPNSISAPDYRYTQAPPPPPLLQPETTTQSTFLRDDVHLILGKPVYLSGPHRNKDTNRVNATLQLHVMDRSDRFIPIDIQRWKMYRFKEHIAAKTKFSGSESGIVVLQDSSDQARSISVAWNEFIENFTPFNVDESSKISGQRGSLFATRDWGAGGANMAPSHHRNVDSRRSSDRHTRPRSHHHN